MNATKWEGFSARPPTEPGLYCWLAHEKQPSVIDVLVRRTLEGNLIAAYADGPEYLPPCHGLDKSRGLWGPKISDHSEWSAFLRMSLGLQP